MLSKRKKRKACMGWMQNTLRQMARRQPQAMRLEWTGEHPAS